MSSRDLSLPIQLLDRADESYRATMDDAHGSSRSLGLGGRRRSMAVRRRCPRAVVGLEAEAMIWALMAAAAASFKGRAIAGSFVSRVLAGKAASPRYMPREAADLFSFVCSHHIGGSRFLGACSCSVRPRSRCGREICFLGHFFFELCFGFLPRVVSPAAFPATREMQDHLASWLTTDSAKKKILFFY